MTTSVTDGIATESPCLRCGVRTATGRLFGAPTCETCRSGGRHLRVQNYINRLRWAAERTRA